MNRGLVFMLCCSLLLAASLSPAAAADPVNPGSRVTLAWDPSPGTNVIVNYAVYYGVATRTYTNKVDAGTTLTATVSNLVRGKTYYFAATAKDNRGLESDYSNEASTTVPNVPAAPTGLTITLTQ